MNQRRKIRSKLIKPSNIHKYAYGGIFLKLNQWGQTNGGIYLSNLNKDNSWKK